jgi:uncharacterized membrane protein YbhN (UPF0104 family)
MLALVVLYQLCSLLHLKPLEIRSFRVEYPRPAVAFRQLFAAPIEIIGAASIIYFALPDVGNPGYFVVLGIFLASFSAGLISNAPGGIGVFEFVFISAMPDIPKPEVLAALVMFRLLYLLVPLAMSCIIILVTERHSLSEVMALVAGRVRGPSAVLPAAQPDRPAE